MVPTDPQVSEQAMQTILANHQRQQHQQPPSESSSPAMEALDGVLEGLDLGIDVVDVLEGASDIVGAVAEGAGSLIGGIFEGLGGLGG